ncbi:MAG: protein kinase [Planctomycetes bacterium]|nr:protein kinase [Planctomycetota bacterium]
MPESTVSQPMMPAACASCGAGLPLNAQFCPGCGRRVVPVKGYDTATGPRTDGPLPSSAPTQKEEKQTPTEMATAELPARYRVVQMVGKGGMGVVFQCRDSSLDRNVAIKLMSERYMSDQNAERRFLREARAQAILNHENVARVLSAGISSTGRPYLVMEYIEGQDLRKMIKERPGGLDPAKSAELLSQACSALEEAHAQGVIHRDIKPSNLMITRDHRGHELVKVLDLGLAKIIGGSTDLRTITVDTAGMLVGTPAYMSPEQVVGDTVGPRSDLYSIGVVLFEMLTGRLPFESDTLEGWLYQHMHARPPSMSLIRPELVHYPKLEQIVKWLLAKRPEDRPESARELREALLKSQDDDATAPKNEDRRTSTLHTLPKETETGVTGTHSTGPRVPPEALFPQPDLLADKLPPEPNLDPVKLRRERFLELSRAAEEAEVQRKWAEAMDLYMQALKHADDPVTVHAQIDSLRREMAFEQMLATVSTYATSGDWVRAELALSNAAVLRPADPRIDQVRARMPYRLIDAWMDAAKTRLAGLPEGNVRSELMRKLAVSSARVGNLQGAMRLLQDECREPEQRIISLAHAIVANIQSGTREGLRPYLDRAVVAARKLTRPAARGNACLELGRALTAYGDLEAAANVFKAAVAAYLDVHSPALDGTDDETNTTLANLRRTSTTFFGAGRRSTNVNSPRPEALMQHAVAAVSCAQAEAGLADEGIATAELLDDPWTRSQTMAHVAQTLARIGRSVEAERIAEQITFRLPKAQAMRAVAVSRIYRGEIEAAEESLREIASPEQRAPVFGYLAAAYARRNENAKAQSCAGEALATSLEVPGTTARFEALLNAIEPLLNTGHLPLLNPLLTAAQRLIDKTDAPVERVRSLLRLAEIQHRTKARAEHTGAAGPTPTAPPIVQDALRRALGGLRTMRSKEDREACLEYMARALAQANASDLVDDLFSLTQNEMERALVYLGLSTGMV